ncbi:MAG TPA: hypothetical protein VG982_02685 [Candidatus Paceibacterota bacterium]|nr:hypothetical protein [Candidatus Paceibacterota bacterium]
MNQIVKSSTNTVTVATGLLVDAVLKSIETVTDESARKFLSYSDEGAQVVRILILALKTHAIGELMLLQDPGVNWFKTEIDEPSIVVKGVIICTSEMRRAELHELKEQISKFFKNEFGWGIITIDDNASPTAFYEGKISVTVSLALQSEF